MPSPAPTLLDALPAAWLADPLVCSRRSELAGARAVGDDQTLVTLTRTPEGLAVSGYGLGAGGLVARVAAAGLLDEPLLRIDLPRPAGLPEDLTRSLRLELQPGWDWLWTRTMPPPPAVEVTALDPVADGAAIRECLADANPDNWGQPGSPDDAGWWGVTGDGRLAGVIGAAAHPGAGADGASWHLKGLAVRDAARGRGLGTALTAAATRDGLAAGLDWVSLGVWAANLNAIRLYHRLGFETIHRRASWRPSDDVHTPACDG